MASESSGFLSSSRNYFCRNWHRKLAGAFCASQARLPEFHRAGPSTPLDEHKVLIYLVNEST